ncbi:MAG: DNA starvation/stationary phase protection protein [Bacteroidetes bacterium]|nr:DNA starvation/stationary phase protection protein [Bacteroidota bacterium]
MAKKTSLNYIGLDADQSAKLTQKLNTLLATYSVFYINTRGYHWNIKGNDFFELHVKFEELYEDLKLKIDEIAERIATLGHTPLHSYSDYVKTSQVKETRDVSDGKTAVKHILDSFQKLLVQQRDLLDISAQTGDEGTNSLMSDYISQQEKLAWMYASYLGR